MPLEPSNEPKETVSRFEKLLVALAQARIDFAVVGGLAVILNGYPRLTVDVDILVNWIVDVKGCRRWAFPLTVIGMNSIAAYTVTMLFSFKQIGNIFVGSLLPVSSPGTASSRP